MKVLFDLNVLLDVFTDRSPFVVDSKPALQLVLDGKVDGYICAISVTTLFYLAANSVGKAQAEILVQRCLALFEIAAVDQAVLLIAANMPGDDFEDRVQFVSALRAGVEAIVTRDRKGFHDSPIPVFAPAELIAKVK